MRKIEIINGEKFVPVIAVDEMGYTAFFIVGPDDLRTEITSKLFEAKVMFPDKRVSYETIVAIAGNYVTDGPHQGELCPRLGVMVHDHDKEIFVDIVELKICAK